MTIGCDEMKISGLKEKYLQDLNYFLDYADHKRGIENDEKYPEETFHLNFYLIVEIKIYLLSSFLEFNIKISLNKSNIDESKLAI